MKPLCLTVICLTLMHALPKADLGHALLLLFVTVMFSSFILAAPRSK